jgi:hypothetical protein
MGGRLNLGGADAAAGCKAAEEDTEAPAADVTHRWHHDILRWVAGGNKRRKSVLVRCRAART